MVTKYCDGFLAKTVTKPLANIYDVLENEICSDQGYLFHFYQKEQRKHVGLNVAHLLTFRNK